MFERLSVLRKVVFCHQITKTLNFTKYIYLVFSLVYFSVLEL